MSAPVHERCEFCPAPATHCYREGRGTGHSEHVCACAEHTEREPLGPLGQRVLGAVQVRR